MVISAGQAVGVPRFSEVMAAIAGRLPFGLSKVVPGDLIGFGVISGGTFALDLGLLTVMRSGLGWPLPVAITIGYVIAFSVNYLLNRVFNYRSHAPVGPQAGVYALVVLVNYLVCILGVGAGLAAVGVDYHLARVLAGGCEAVFMYAAVRWVVFRREGGTPSPAGSSGSPGSPASPGTRR